MKKTLISALAFMLLVQLAACSTYSGPITNAPDTSDISGPPLLTGKFAP